VFSAFLHWCLRGIVIQPNNMDRWEELSGLVAQAMEQPLEQRVKFVVENTTEGPLREEALALVEAGELEYLERGAGVDLGMLVEPTLGNCRIVRKIGEGGMGTVYEAVRTLELGTEQQVAVKVWHRAGLSPVEIQREARLLGRLDHPGIARLLDTGITDRGQAFLVMELVKGEPLSRYAEGRSLDEKLELIGRLCEAVEAAHRALIAHRDLKPSNVLVTEEGVLKLIDFGISKAEDDEGKTVAARLTPRYASPEQLRGETITAATDIYSLGVVMYEVLTGKNPFEGADRTVVPKPDLPTELASIVLKAMAVKPEERYESVLALREDLRRYRSGEPVRAVEATWGYRARKFVVRQRVALAVCLLLVIGFGKAYWEQRNAARRFDQVRGLARSLLFEIHDEVSKVPGTLESRKLIVSRALEYLDQLSQDESADDRLQKDLAESYLKVGNLQGTLVRSNESLGRYGDAQGSFRKAVVILERLVAQSPRDRETRLQMAKALDGVAEACTRVKDAACAVDFYRRALALYGLDAKENPGDFMAQTRWLTSRITQLEPLVQKKDYQKLRAELQVVAEAFVELGRKHPGEAKMRAFQAYAYKRLGAVEGVLGNYAVGIGWYEKAMELHRLAKDRMGESTCEVDIAWALQRDGKLAESKAAMDRALAIRRELAVGRGQDQQSKLSLVSVMFRKALLLEQEKRWVEGLALLEEASALLKSMEGAAKQNRLISDMIHQVELMRGDALWETGRREAAKVAYAKGLAADRPRDVEEARVVQARKRVGQTGWSGPGTPLQ
jgi:tetratricopeptide (TPR) repeat protein